MPALHETLMGDRFLRSVQSSLKKIADELESLRLLHEHRAGITAAEIRANNARREK